MADITYSILKYWLKNDLTGTREGAPVFACRSELRLYQQEDMPKPYTIYAGPAYMMESFAGSFASAPGDNEPYGFLCCACSADMEISKDLPSTSFQKMIVFACWVNL